MSATLPVEEVRHAARGRWAEVFEGLLWITRDQLRRNGPCPKCGGTDRFFAHRDFDETGGVACRQCRPDNADGFGAIAWLLDVSFPEAVRQVAGHLGIAIDDRPRKGNAVPSHQPARSPDPLADVCQAKRIPSVDSLRAFGAKPDRNGVRVPQYGPDGKPCSSQWIPPVGKKLNEKGKPVGVFLAGGTLPKAGDDLILCEGALDAATWHALGFQAVGIVGAQVGPKFAPLFAGVNVTIVPDRDAAGMKGAERSARILYGHAASVRIAHWPRPLADSKGCDVRDVLAQEGEATVRETIARATAWKPSSDDDTPSDAGDALNGACDDDASQEAPSDFQTLATLLPAFRDAILAEGNEPTRRTFLIGAGMSGIDVGPGLITLVGGLPGAGKTALVMNWAVEALLAELDVRAMVCNVEMGPTDLLTRQLARMSGVPLWAIERRTYEPDDREAIERAIASLSKVGDRLAFIERVTVDRIGRAVEAFGATLLVVDYVQRIPVVGASDPRIRAEAVMSELRRIAMQGVAVVAVAALNRNPGSDLASFRDASELEYGADVALLLKGDAKQPQRTLACVKNRYGSLADHAFDFDGEVQRFTTGGGFAELEY